MHKQAPILRQVLSLTLAVAACSAVMLGIYALAGRFTVQVLLGAGIGTLLAAGNFLALSITVSNAIDRAARSAEPVRARLSIQSSSMIRTLVLVVIYILLFRADVCDPVAALLPLIFAQFAIKLLEFFRKDDKGGDAAQ